jgi:hypothetical protein
MNEIFPVDQSKVSQAGPERQPVEPVCEIRGRVADPTVAHNWL